tara:strand:+ start:12422 stop:16069 length:3648 start_codon:yes stop_codon:yes gene_type:complete
MSNKGIVTREDVFKQEAITAPLEYAKNLQIAIDLQKQIVAVLVETNQLSKDFKGAKTSKEIIDLKSKEVTLQQKYADLLTKQRRSELEMQKIKEKEIAIKNKEITLQNKINTQRNRSKTLTDQEKVDNSILNRLKKEEAILNSNLVGSYQKLNLKRSQASKNLRDLIASGKASRLEIQLATKQFEKYDKKVRQADQAVGDFTKNVGNYKTALAGIKGTIRNLVGAFGFTSGIAIFASLMKGAFERVREFDKSMQNLSGILRVSRSDLKGLEETIIDVAGSSVKTSNEVATLAEKLITLGKTKEDVEKLLKPVVDLGIGLDTTGEEAGEFLVQMLNTFGASTDEAGKYADTIATIRTSTSLDFQKMRDSFQYLAPISRALNKDLAYTGALVGILADNGIKAERAGRLMGTSQQKLASEGKSLNDALNELNEAKSTGVSELELLALSSKLFGKQSSALGLVLANNTDLIEENAQAIRENGGALEDLVNQQLESMDAKLKILDSSWEKLVLNIDKGDGAISTFFKSAIVGATDFLNVLTDINTVTEIIGESEETSFWQRIFPTAGIVKGVKDFSRLRDSTKEYQAILKEFNTIDSSNINEVQAGIDVWTDMKKEVEGNVEATKILDFFIGKLQKSQTAYFESARNEDDEKRKREKGDVEEKNKLTEEEQEKANKLSEKKRENQQKLNESFKKSEFELAQEQIQISIEKNKKLATDENKSFEEKTKANINLKKILTNLNNTQLAEDLRLLNEQLKNKEISENEYAVRMQLLGIKKSALEEDVQEQITANLEKALKHRFDLEKKKIDDAKLLNDNDVQAKIDAEFSLLKNKQISLEDYNKNVAEIQKDALLEDLENQENQALKSLEFKQLSEEQKAEIQKQYADVRKQINDAETADEIENLKKAEEQKREIIGQTSDFIAQALGLDSSNIQNLMNGIVDGFDSFSDKIQASLAVAGDVINSIANISAGFSEDRIAQIDNEIEKNDEKFNNLLANEELTLEQRSLLEAQKQREQDKLEKKKRKEKEKQAKIDKANVLAQIVIQTALGIVSAASAIVTLPLVPVIAAIGAVQFAIAAAQPIPKFKDGHLAGTHQGWAITNDGGKQEILERNGMAHLIQGVNTPIYMQKGDKVYKSEEDYHRRVANNAFKDLNNQRDRVEKAQELSANDNKINEIILGSYVAKALSQERGTIKKEIKEGLKKIGVTVNINNDSGNTIFKNNDW